MKFFFSILLGLNLHNAYAQQPDSSITDAQKIYGLSRFWQEANYNYAYFSNVPHLNWDSAYLVFIPRVLATKNVFSYYRELQKFCALLQDGHTNVWLPEYISKNMSRRSFGDIKLELRNIDSKPIVVNTALATKNVVPIGSERVQVNNLPVKDYVNQQVRPFISQSAPYITEDWCASYLLDGFNGDTIRIGFKKPGTDKAVHSLLLKREVRDDVAWLKPNNLTLFKLHLLAGGVAKVDLNSFEDPAIVDSFITALPALQKAKGIIIDLRNNGGGSSNNAAAILSYFTDADSIRGSKWFTRQHRSAYKAWGTYAMEDMSDTSEDSKELREYYKGNVWYEGGQMKVPNKAPAEKRMTTVPLVVLLGHQTASAAEDFLIMLDGLANRAVTMGQRSFASTGQPLPFALPGGGSARICTKKDTYPDGRVFVGVGIVPKVEVNPTLDDYLAGKDVALARALAELQKK